MQATPGLQQTAPRPLAAALLITLAAAVLMLAAAAGGYWVRGVSSAPATTTVTVTQPATNVAPSSVQSNEQSRQRLIKANQFDGSLPAAPAVKAPQHI